MAGATDNEELEEAPESAHVKTHGTRGFRTRSLRLAPFHALGRGRRSGLMFVAFATSFEAFS